MTENASVLEILSGMSCPEHESMEGHYDIFPTLTISLKNPISIISSWELFDLPKSMKVYMACLVGITKSNINNCIYFKNDCWQTWNTILFVKHTITHFQRCLFFNYMYLFYFVHKNDAYNKNNYEGGARNIVFLFKLKLKVSSFLNKKKCRRYFGLH